MSYPIRQALPLLVSLALLGIGSTLVASLVGLQISRRDFPEITFGLVGAGFAFGGILGANIAPRIITRAGHLHSFAALAALLEINVFSPGGLVPLSRGAGIDFIPTVMDALERKFDWGRARGGRSNAELNLATG